MAEGGAAPDPAVLEQEETFQREWSRRNAVLSLVTNISLVVLAGPLYVFHWRRIERPSVLVDQR
jgi:hypothetical protein